MRLKSLTSGRISASSPISRFDTSGTRAAKLIAVTALPGSVTSDTRIGFPFRNAPPPLTAENISSSAGA